jgi:hypothetical protein
MDPSFAGNEWIGNNLTGYRIALTARETTSPKPMITVSSNNQAIGVILDFMRHPLIGFICRQTDMYIVYSNPGQKANNFLFTVSVLFLRKGAA